MPTTKQQGMSTIPDSTTQSSEKIDEKSTDKKISPNGVKAEAIQQENSEDRESIHSESSNYSSSNAIARKRAEVSKAKAKMEYLTKELNIRRKQMELEAELELLALEHEATVAEVECQALESSMGHVSQASRPNSPDSNVGMEQRRNSLISPNSQAASSQYARPLPGPGSSTLNSNVQPYIPVQQASPQIADVTRFLLRKDLLFSRLTNFNDRPETYSAWKASFLCVVDELQITDNEQIDLLIKYLGPESRKHALSIKTSNAYDMSRGVQQLWQRLDERYGAPELVEASIRAKVTNFPRLGNKDCGKLYDLSDILMEMQFLKEDPRYSCMLSYLDSSIGINPIVAKLPYSIQEKWTNRAMKFKNVHGDLFPPFHIFVDFIKDMSKLKNDPCFIYEQNSETNRSNNLAPSKQAPSRKTGVSVKKTAVETSVPLCILHKTRHSLDDCRRFKSKSLEERKKLLKQNNMCLRCCASDSHKSRECNAVISCKDCKSKNHTTALHVTSFRNDPLISMDTDETRPTSSKESKDCVYPASSKEHGGEYSGGNKSVSQITSSCTEICKDSYGGTSCAKILPVNVFHRDSPEKLMKIYAVIDDQSNRSLAAPELFEFFGIRDQPQNYTMLTCAGRVVTTGRRGTGFVLTSLGGDIDLDLPTLIECDYIPNNRDEIPTPEVTLHHEHLKEITHQIQPLDDERHILLLIGRDLIEAHHVIHQIFGPPKAPYAQQLRLGLVVIGETCLKTQHASQDLSVKKTYMLPTGQPTILKPCTNKFEIREQIDHSMSDELQLFVKTKDDDKPGLSIEDKLFLNQMDDGFIRDSSGSWVAPLPFRDKRRVLPDNKAQAVKRAKMLDASLRKNDLKREHFLTFMGKILDNNHAEVAPAISDGEERWYLPLFGVYHPKKPDQIRGVFDASARFDGVSLNDVLLSGPDLCNSLLGVLVRFRKEMVAVTADVQHMFHCFVVREDHRNFLRFLWHKDNDFDKEIIEYRMRVHVFGNSPSPAVATLGLRKAVEAAEPKYGDHVAEFVKNNFTSMTV